MAEAEEVGVSAAELELAQWRRRTAETYSAARQRSRTNPTLAWEEYRARRDEMFRSHPQSPL